MDRINVGDHRLVSVEGLDRSGQRVTFAGDYFLHFHDASARPHPGDFGDVPAEAAGSERGARLSRLHYPMGWLVSKLKLTRNWTGPCSKDN